MATLSQPTQSQPAQPSRSTAQILLVIWHAFLVFVGLGLCFLAYWVGFLFNALFLILLFLVCGMAVSRIMGTARKTLELRFIRHPFAREVRKYLLQAINQWTFVLLVVFVLHLAIIPAQFSQEELRSVRLVVWGAATFVALFALIPKQTVRVTTNIFFAVASIFLGTELVRIHLPVSSADRPMVLDPPFAGEWYIFQGGRSALINHHYPIRGQRHALDIIKTEAGKERKGDKAVLTSYLSYGQPVYAPADGRVINAVNDRPDLQIGKTDHEQITGNHLLLELEDGRFLLMAHLKQGSVRVTPGEHVRRGQPVAACGNSGNTSAPHLHLQVQSRAEFADPQLRTYPIIFRNVTRERAGRHQQLAAADVRRNDRLFTSLAPRGGEGAR